MEIITPLEQAKRMKKEFGLDKAKTEITLMLTTAELNELEFLQEVENNLDIMIGMEKVDEDLK